MLMNLKTVREFEMSRISNKVHEKIHQFKNGQRKKIPISKKNHENMFMKLKTVREFEVS